MQLTFSLLLGQTTTVKVPPAPLISDKSSSFQTIHFKATFDSHASCLKAQTDGIRLELWTDIPAQGRSRGEWGAVPFIQVNSGSQESMTLSESSSSLLTETEAGKHEDSVTLHLSLRAPLQDRIGSRFQFTYRLVYPSGRVEWLGTNDSNGVVVVERGLPGINLSAAWEVREDGKYHLAAATKGDLIHLEEPESWSIWAWKMSGFPTQLAIGAELVVRGLVLLPRASLRDIATPVVLAFNSALTVCLTPDGTVSQALAASDVKQAVLGAVEYSQDLLEEVVSACSGTILASNPAYVTIASSLQAGVYPMHLLVLPTAATGSLPSMHVQDLQSIVPSNELVLFSPGTYGVKALTPSSPAHDLHDFICSSDGEALVSPLRVVRDDNKVWRIALFAPHSDTTTRIQRPLPKQHLPTPPPSPPVTSASVPHPEMRDLSQRSAEPGDVTRSVSSPQPAQSPHSRRKLSLAVARNLPSRLLRAYLHTLFNLIFWFWNVFFRALAVRLVGEGIPRRISSLLGLALTVTASSRNPRRRAEDTQTRRLLNTSIAPPGQSRTHIVEDTAKAQSTTRHISAPQPQQPTSGSSSEEQGVSSDSTPRLVFSADLVKGHAAPFIVLQHSGTALEAHATFNGKILPILSFRSVVDTTHTVLELADIPSEGRLEVSWNL